MTDLIDVEEGDTKRSGYGPRSKVIAERIALARQKCRKSVEECARSLDLSVSQFKYLEKHFPVDQALALLPRLAETLQVSLGWFEVENSDVGHVDSADHFPVLTLEQAAWFGTRAKLRREELLLSRSGIAESIGVSPINILTWERSLPRKRRVVESAWEKQLQVPDGWLRSAHLQPNPPASFPISEFESGRTVVDEMRAICSWFSRRSAYHRTTSFDLLSDSERRMAEIMMFRFGAQGEEASTLQRIGDRIGLTRQRVQQIGEDFNSNLDDLAIETPALDKLKVDIQEKLPSKVEDLDRHFRGLLGESLSIIGADRFARELLGKSLVKISANPTSMQGHSIPIAVQENAPDIAELRAIRQVAVTMIRITGAAQVHFVAGMSSTVLTRGVAPEEVARACRTFSNFEWLSEEDGWFWFGHIPDNRAKTAALKVLSVATRNVDVEEIHDAMSRARLHRYDPDRPRPYLIDAPVTILKEVITRIPGIQTLQYDDFRLDALISPEEVLSDTELAILGVVMRHGGVSTRQLINEEVLASLDVTPVALSFALYTSPIFVRLDKGIWSIRGNRLNAQAVASAVSRTTNNNVARRFFLEQTEPQDGWWTLRVTVPESAFTRRNWIVPVAVANLLQPGEYEVDGYADPAVYFLSTNPNLGGLVGKLIEAGIGPGEIFLLSIHDTKRFLRFEKQNMQLANVSAD